MHPFSRSCALPFGHLTGREPSSPRADVSTAGHDESRDTPGPWAWLRPPAHCSFVLGSPAVPQLSASGWEKRQAGRLSARGLALPTESLKSGEQYNHG